MACAIVEARVTGAGGVETGVLVRARAWGVRVGVNLYGGVGVHMTCSDRARVLVLVRMARQHGRGREALQGQSHGHEPHQSKSSDAPHAKSLVDPWIDRKGKVNELASSRSSSILTLIVLMEIAARGFPSAAVGSRNTLDFLAPTQGEHRWMTMTLRSFNQQLALLATLISACFATSATAQVVGIVWDGSRAFETNAALASGKFAEVCGKLSKGQVVVWTFDGDRPLDFNIHYHAGAQVVFPEQRGAVSDGSGELTVATDQDYCWMWTNRAQTPARVALKLRLR